jgi:hypothetical protein
MAKIGENQFFCKNFVYSQFFSILLSIYFKEQQQQTGRHTFLAE